MLTPKPMPTFPLEGGCRCAAVRFQLTAAPFLEAACHCRGCQRMSSSAFSLTALCHAESFTLTKGEVVPGGMRAADLPHFFCGNCLSWMFTRPAMLPDIVNVRVALFDDPSWFAPFMETCTSTKLPWVELGAVRSFAMFPEMDGFEGIIAEYREWRGPGSPPTS